MSRPERPDRHISRMRVIRHEQQPYLQSVSEQESIVADLLAGHAGQTLILTEHPPVFTIGASGSPADVLSHKIDGETIDAYPSGRGGEVTYHGPGQLVCYVIADLRAERDLHRHVWRLEEMVIRTLADFAIAGRRNPRGIGVWVNELKIAAAGVRCRKWVAFHGISLNISTNLRHYAGIVPCGMSDAPVTSMHSLGRGVDRDTVEQALIIHANALFD
jgi:lipoyl(octanoyl) transferase